MSSAAAHATDATVLTVYRRLFDDLERDAVDYVVWKNLNELPDALSGHGDIDLHVRPRSRAAFLDALRAHRFVRIETHKGHPWVAHYYGLDETSGTLCHLHCYFRLVTGESHIKQYVVPVERHLDSLPAERNAHGVREMHPWLQAKLYLFRRRIKLSCLPGALLFNRERAGYRAEQALLERHRSLPDERLADERLADERLAGDGWPATITESGSLAQDIATGLLYRRRFRHWSRFAPFTTPIRRYGVIPVRALGKLRGWRKTLPLGLLVVVEAEGEQARRIRREIDDWLGAAFRLHSFPLPDTDEVTTPRALLRRCRRRQSALRAAMRAAADGSLSVCYGWYPSRLRGTLADTASASGTSATLRRALERCMTQLDDAAEPDLVLHVGGAPASEEERHGATPVEVDADATARWRRTLWRALVARQP